MLALICYKILSISAHSVNILHIFWLVAENNDKKKCKMYFFTCCTVIHLPFSANILATFSKDYCHKTFGLTCCHSGLGIRGQGISAEI